MAQDPNPAGGDAGGDAVLSAEQAKEIYTKLTGQAHCAQADYFLNVYFDKLDDKDKDKDAVVALLEQFAKHGEDKNSVNSIAFMALMQKLETHKKIKDANKVISDRFKASGVKEGDKKKPEIPIFDALLAVFGFTLVDTMNLPASPCDARKRAAEAQMKEVEHRDDPFHAQIAAIQAEIDKIDPGKVVTINTKKNEIKVVKAQMKESARVKQNDADWRAAKKAVEDAKTALAAETKEGTPASNWLKDECKKAHLKFIPFELD